MKTTATHIELVAQANGMTVDTIIRGHFDDEEELRVVNMGNFRFATFVMDNETFDFHFENVYNPATDKTSYRLPKIFK